MEKEIDLKSDVKVFGFWIYLMTDLVLFAALFATFLVLHKSTFGGPSGRDIFEMPSVLTETLILLASSFTCAMGMLGVYQKRKIISTAWFILTFLLGMIFLIFEILEFHKLIQQGNGPNYSAFLSSFFTLVGTHGLHITIGLLWMIVEIFRIQLKPLLKENISRIFRMAIFWHFLDFVWIFIFTTVYGMEYLFLL